MSKTDSGEVTLSERDPFWLKHPEAQAALGQSGKESAAEKDLSLHAVYPGPKRLRGGSGETPLMAVHGNSRSQLRDTATGFIRPSPTPASRAAPLCRLRAAPRRPSRGEASRRAPRCSWETWVAPPRFPVSQPVPTLNICSAGV